MKNVPYQFACGVNHDMDRLKWEADIREQEMDRLLVALKTIRSIFGRSEPVLDEILRTVNV